MYDKICEVIGFKVEGITYANQQKTFSMRASLMKDVKIHLLKSKSAKFSTLIVRFPTVFQKECFLSQYYLSAKILTLDKLGFKGGKEKDLVCIYPNLTKKRYEVFKTALKKKKDGEISYVKISSFGDVSVRVVNIQKFEVQSIVELEDVCSTADVSGPVIVDTQSSQDSDSENENVEENQ